MLPFEIDRPLVFFDLETTGLHTRRDRIVELALVKYTPEGEVIERVRRLNPEMPIPAQATAVHGIGDEDVENEVTFRRVARSLYHDYFAGADLGGYNARRFDVPMLAAEFARCGIELDLTEIRVVDPSVIFHAMEPRNLAAATLKFLNREMENQHSALADTRAAAEVFFAQVEHYGDLPRSVDGINSFCDEHVRILTEVDRWFSGDDGGRIFKRGKHRGVSLTEVAEADPDYLRWMAFEAEDMAQEVRDLVAGALGH